MLYRVVLSCWDNEEVFPYPAYLSGYKPLSLFSTKEKAMESIKTNIEKELIFYNDLESKNPKKKMPVLDSDGNIVSYEYPFRADFDGKDSGIVRFWDGDNYKNVTAYNIYELNCPSDNLDKCSYYIYRGFFIRPNEMHTSFIIEASSNFIPIEKFRFKSLDKALREIDLYFAKLQKK